MPPLHLLAAYCFFWFHASVSAAGCWRNSNCAYGPSGPSFSGVWDKYNYSPTSRTISPITIYSTGFDNISSFPPANPAILSGNGSTLIFDFGKEVAGIITVAYTAQGEGTMGLAFSEARNWTGQWSDDSNSFDTIDGAIYANITATSFGAYTMPDAKLRGGFRYLTLFTETSSTISVAISNITLEISFAPTWSDLRAYGGYFYSSDEMLNRIWYAGAYTLQTNSIAATTGREYPVQASGWKNDADLHPGVVDPTIYVDGAKRDRIVWAGDCSISIPSILAGTGDWNGVRYTIDALYDAQASNGGLPFAGPAAFFYSSDTYHLATMLGTYEYILWTNDGPWINYVYPKYKAAMAFIIGKMDSSGMLYVTGTNDWGRLEQGGHNTEANVLLYRALTTGSQIATWAGDSTSSSTWTSMAAQLKTTINNNLWDSTAGAYKDSDTNGNVHPEDGNSMALLFGVVSSDTAAQSISNQLTTNWGPLGAISPELPGNHVPFIQSFEIKAHFAASQPIRALDLIRRSWGWYLDNPFGTQSTCVEGYLPDGSFGYRATTGYNGDYSFTSHSHGWSTGPVAALSTYIVGLSLTAPAGSQWELAPQFGNLTSAEGGFTTPLGTFSAGWEWIEEGKYTLWYQAPTGTTGTIVTPGTQSNIIMDGNAKAQDQGNDKVVILTVEGDNERHELKFS
ncbi:glycoside hydrolase family 78 protein [Trichoderma sp. SZMC 28014]